MKIENYLSEAALALGAPNRLVTLQDYFNYDQEKQAWSFSDSHSERPESLMDMMGWCHMTCGWLQFRYPDGPIWTHR